MVRADLGWVGDVAEASGLFPTDMAEGLAAPALDDEGGQIWLVADERKGFAYARAEEMTDNSWNILAIAVAEAARGQGIGRRLIAEMERVTGARLIIIETTQRDAQASARALYEKEGYRVAGHIPQFYAPGEDKIIFTKVLA